MIYTKFAFHGFNGKKGKLFSFIHALSHCRYFTSYNFQSEILFSLLIFLGWIHQQNFKVLMCQLMRFDFHLEIGLRTHRRKSF